MQVVELGAELWQCPETLFRQGIAGAGLHDHLFNSINRCEIDARPAMYSNVILAGGTNCFDGVASRLQVALPQRARAPPAELPLPNRRACRTLQVRARHRCLARR